MSLSRREQRQLKGIDEAVARSDPQLAAKLATFARLTAAEQIPSRESVRTFASRVRSVAATCMPRRWRRSPASPAQPASAPGPQAARQTQPPAPPRHPRTARGTDYPDLSGP